jgi:serine/threonine protein kinase
MYALKLVRQSQEEYCQRFQHEAKMLMRLHHPHILPLLAYGTEEDFCYYVMPYIPNGTLKDRLNRGALPEREVAHILSQVADALHFLHEAGFVHRDIKPSNILLGEADHVWLADFGLVRALEGGSDFTRTGCLLGTPSYMAPELASVQANVKSDVYALGVVLYEMLTGRLPFKNHGTPLEIYLKQVNEQPPAPSLVNPRISPAREQVVLRALEKDPAHRYASVQAMAEAYREAWLADPTDASPAQHLPHGEEGAWKIKSARAIRMVKPEQVRRMPLALGALTIVVLLTMCLGRASQNGHGLFSHPAVVVQKEAAHPPSTPQAKKTVGTTPVPAASPVQPSGTPGKGPHHPPGTPPAGTGQHNQPGHPHAGKGQHNPPGHPHAGKGQHG